MSEKPVMGAPDDIPLVWGLHDEIERLTNALRDVDAFLSDPDGANPIDSINLARKVIRDTIG